jgi:hypothetical protein
MLGPVGAGRSAVPGGRIEETTSHSGYAKWLELFVLHGCPEMSSALRA